MKILLLSPFPPFRGGIAQFGSRLLPALRELNHEVAGINYSHLYPDFLFPGKTQLENSNLSPEGILHGYNPLEWISARKKLRAYNADLVISQWWHPFFAPCLSASIPPEVRKVAVCHNIIPHETFPFARALAKRFLKEQYLLAVHSKGAERDGTAMGGKVVRLFIPVYDQYRNTGLPRKEARLRLGLNDNQTALLFFGLIRDYKGLDILIKAAEMLPDNFRIIAAGENYTSNEYFSERLFLKNAFIPDTEVGTWFNAADIVVLPYRSATQSAVAQIAISFAKPLVVTPTGGLPEVVEQGVTGTVAECISPEAVAKAINQCSSFCSDPRTVERIREKAENFSWISYAAKLMEALS